MEEKETNKVEGNTKRERRREREKEGRDCMNAHV